MCAGACNSVSSIFSVNSSNHSGRSRKRVVRFFPVIPLFTLVFELRVIRNTLMELVRHFVLGLDLLKTNPAMSMLTTNCSQNWWISPFCVQLSSPSLVNCVFLTGDPLMGVSVVFAEFSKRHNSTRFFE